MLPVSHLFVIMKLKVKSILLVGLVPHTQPLGGISDHLHDVDLELDSLFEVLVHDFQTSACSGKRIPPFQERAVLLTQSINSPQLRGTLNS